MMANSYKPSTWKAKTGGSRVQGQSPLYSGFEVARATGDPVWEKKKKKKSFISRVEWGQRF